MPAKAAISLNLYGFVSQTYQITPIMGTVLGHKYVFQQMLTMIYDSHFLRVLWHSYNSFVLRARKSHFTHPQCQGKAIASVDQRERGLELVQEQHTGVWSRAEEHSAQPTSPFPDLPSLVGVPGGSWAAAMSVLPVPDRDRAPGQGMSPDLRALQGLSTWQTLFLSPVETAKRI